MSKAIRVTKDCRFSHNGVDSTVYTADEYIADCADETAVRMVELGYAEEVDPASIPTEEVTDAQEDPVVCSDEGADEFARESVRDETFEEEEAEEE
jgi:hypothetical protein